MNRITITINGRTVHWDVTSDVSAYFLQNLVSMWGPAEEEDEEDS